MTDTLTITTYAESAYLQYAAAVVKGRALASVQDGLKPVQRRILFAMMQLGLRPPAKAVKSARVVGDVLGKYHPHGDQSVYDALVRMAQPFTLRYPLIEGQGNFGSLDGDGAAAMRYTEARLSPLAELLLAELAHGTVDYVPNYDGTLKEPALTPARLPELLLNGTMGVAVGMAANIPAHNLREVCDACRVVVENPAATLDQVLQHIQGPDFPGGGQLISTPEEVREAYGAGRGGLRCRARWVKEDLARNQWQIVVKELPYQVSTRKILEELDTLTNPQPKSGKKTLTQQQANLKALALDFIEKATDESDKDSGIRLVLVPRNGKVDPDAMMSFLLANTSLEAGVPINMTLIGLDGNPRTAGILPILTEWAEFRLATVRRRTAFELQGTQKRIHILEGRLLAFNRIDEIVQTIRESVDPREELITRFALTEVQADDILEMKLRQLNRLEGSKLEQELTGLKKEESRLAALLANESALRKLIVTEIEADKARFGDERRTLVAPASRAKAIPASKAVLDEPLTVVISQNLWVKAYKGHELPEESLVFKPGDALWQKAETFTTKQVALIDSAGRAYSLEAATIPVGRGEGAPLPTFVELQDNASPVALISGEPDDLWLFAGAKGYGFTAPLKSLYSRQKAGKAFLRVEPDEQVLPPQKMAGEHGYVLAASAENKLLAFKSEEVKTLAGGGKGVVLMNVGETGKLAHVRFVPAASAQVSASKGGKTETLRLEGEAWARHLSVRGRKGSFLTNKAEILLLAPVSS